MWKKDTFFGQKHTLFGRQLGGEVLGALTKKIYPVLFLKYLGPLAVKSNIIMIDSDCTHHEHELPVSFIYRVLQSLKTLHGPFAMLLELSVVI